MAKCFQSGVCCKLFLINLSKEEYESEQYETVFDEHIEDWNLAEQAGAHFLKQKPNGECIYLKDNLCSIHERRPNVCKGFFCDSKEEKYKEMIKEVKKAKFVE